MTVAPPAFGVTLLVSRLEDDGSVGTLRHAIELANATPGEDQIVFGVIGTIELQSALPPIIDHLNLIGPGPETLALGRDPAAGDLRILNIQLGANVLLSGLTIQDGRMPLGGGAGIRSAGGTLIVAHCHFRNNLLAGRSDVGAAIFHTVSAKLLVTDSFFENNDAGDNGGGGAINCNQTIDATIERCTFVGNSAPFGSAVYGSMVSGTIEIINSTFSGNTGSGPVALIASGGAPVLSLRYCTVTNNTCDVAAVWSANNGGQAEILLENTIVAGNIGLELLAGGGGAFTSLGYNLIEESSGAFDAFPPGLPNANNDWVGTTIEPLDAMLRPLADNGGLWPTHIPAFSSPAIDHGSEVLPTPPIDQRGVVRPIDGDGDGTATPDIGAIELLPGDFDGDGRVTLTDYTMFADCLSGPGTSPTPQFPTTAPTCLDHFDIDADTDVDMFDYRAILRHFED